MKSKSEIYVLGIESSCDETAVGIVSSNGEIMSNIVWSQLTLHQEYGGVIPELAARNHLLNFDQILTQAIQASNLKWEQLYGICATAGPGLSGGLIVGLTAGKTLALALNKPFYAVNHLEGHALIVNLTNKTNPPYLLLLMSGGHTQILMVHNIGQYELLGTTIDDALGECFDKLAKMLELTPYNGSTIEKYAQKGQLGYFQLPCPMLGKKDCNFSFAGLKSFISNLLQNSSLLNLQDKANLCTSFQHTISKILNSKLQIAIQKTKNLTDTIVLSGGVAANKMIKQSLEELAIKNGMKLVVPPAQYCTDNAVMIAWAGLCNFLMNRTSKMDCSIYPNWPL